MAEKVLNLEMHRAGLNKESFKVMFNDARDVLQPHFKDSDWLFMEAEKIMWWAMVGKGEIVLPDTTITKVKEGIIKSLEAIKVRLKKEKELDCKGVQDALGRIGDKVKILV